MKFLNLIFTPRLPRNIPFNASYVPAPKFPTTTAANNISLVGASAIYKTPVPHASTEALTIIERIADRCCNPPSLRRTNAMLDWPAP